MPRPAKILLLLVFFLPFTLAPSAGAPTQAEAAPSRLAAEVAELVTAQNVEALRAKGEGILPILVDLYRRADVPGRANLAWIFYQLAWPSEAAKIALMADIHTEDESLRLQVQWALGRVSSDDAVVDALFDNLQHDKNALFRNKAACGLANDQIHLSEKQKVRLYQRTIALLESPVPEMRLLSMMMLNTMTGQTKGFIPGAPPEMRAPVVAAWKEWLAEYERNVE